VDIETHVRFLGVDNTIEIWAKDKLEKPLMVPEDFASEIQKLMK
jgi:MraZ protein